MWMDKINVITRPAFFSMGMQIKLSVAIIRKYGLTTIIFSVEIYRADLCIEFKTHKFWLTKISIYVVYYEELFYQHVVFKLIYWNLLQNNITFIYQIVYSIYNRYKNVSKTDVRQSWIHNPNSAPPRQTKTMEELFPAPDRFVNYRLEHNNFLSLVYIKIYLICIFSTCI